MKKKEIVQLILELIKIGIEIYRKLKEETDEKKRKEFLEKLRNRDDISDLFEFD